MHSATAWEDYHKDKKWCVKMQREKMKFEKRTHINKWRLEPANFINLFVEYTEIKVERRIHEEVKYICKIMNYRFLSFSWKRRVLWNLIEMEEKHVDDVLKKLVDVRKRQ